MSDLAPTLRIEIRRLAAGRCEYCLFPEAAALVKHEVDHIIARKHGGQATLDNLAFCRVLCNKHKGSDITSIDPLTGRVEVLFHPRRDLWRDHFELRGTQIVPITPVGRVTVRLLQLNHPERILERATLIEAGFLKLED
jgi:hypothetical protein